jgi:hypothetical protein
MKSQQPQIGERFRDVGSAFRNAIWILSRVSISGGGIEHAHLTSASDATVCKTLALSVVGDPTRFVPTESESRPPGT